MVDSVRWWARVKGIHSINMICPCKIDDWEEILLHKGESKALKYFANVRHNSLVLRALAKVLEVINLIELWSAQLAWCSLLYTRFVSTSWVTGSVFIVLGLLDLARSSKFYKLDQISSTVSLLYSEPVSLHLFYNKCFCSFYSLEHSLGIYCLRLTWPC